MDTGTKSVINQVYFFSFLAVVALLPWSIKGTNYAMMIMIASGLWSTSWKEKINQAGAHKEVIIFAILFLLYAVGLLYTTDLGLGLKSIEKKLVVFIVPLIAVSSISLTDKQRTWAQLSFVFSIAIFTVVCIVLNITSSSGGIYDAQINFDVHTLARFTEFHPDSNPAWMQFSYIAFGYPLIKSTTIFSVYICLSIFILFHYEPISKKIQVLKYATIAFFCIVVILLSSRIGIFILFSVGAFNAFQKFNITSFVRYSLVSVVPLLLLLIISPVTRYRLLEEPLSTPLQLPQDPTRWNSFNIRFLEWGSSTKGIREHGLFGTGTGGKRDVLNSYYDRVNLGDFDADYGSNNQFLETYLEIGIAGFIALLSCFIIPFLIARKNRDIILMSLLMMMGIACLSNSMFESARALPFFIVFVSLFMFTKKKYDSESAR